MSGKVWPNTRCSDWILWQLISGEPINCWNRRTRKSNQAAHHQSIDQPTNLPQAANKEIDEMIIPTRPRNKNKKKCGKQTNSRKHRTIKLASLIPPNDAVVLKMKLMMVNRKYSPPDELKSSRSLCRRFRHIFIFSNGQFHADLFRFPSSSTVNIMDEAAEKAANRFMRMRERFPKAGKSISHQI